jgi:hypothetical protein
MLLLGLRILLPLREWQREGTGWCDWEDLTISFEGSRLLHNIIQHSTSLDALLSLQHLRYSWLHLLNSNYHYRYVDSFQERLSPSKLDCVEQGHASSATRLLAHLTQMTHKEEVHKLT